MHSWKEICEISISQIQIDRSTEPEVICKLQGSLKSLIRQIWFNENTGHLSYKTVLL